jgi:hypothetical protein
MSVPYLDRFKTADYYLSVAPSGLREYKGDVYVVVNRHTGVYEHETTYFSESLGYMLAIQEKLLTAIAAFEDEAESTDIGMPKLH